MGASGRDIHHTPFFVEWKRRNCGVLGPVETKIRLLPGTFIAARILLRANLHARSSAGVHPPRGSLRPPDSRCEPRPPSSPASLWLSNRRPGTDLPVGCARLGGGGRILAQEKMLLRPLSPPSL